MARGQGQLSRLSSKVPAARQRGIGYSKSLPGVGGDFGEGETETPLFLVPLVCPPQGSQELAGYVAASNQ